MNSFRREAESERFSLRRQAGFGGKVTVAPRVFLRELVDIMDRVEQHDTYDPSAQYKLALNSETLTVEELAAKEGREVSSTSEDDEDEPKRGRRLDG